MRNYILEVVFATRGEPHETHQLSSNTTVSKLEHKGQYVDLTYPDLVDALYAKFDILDPDKVRENTLYQRVWRFCRENDIVYRAPNKISKVDEELVDRRCLGTLQQTEKVVKEDNISLEEIASIDETGFRPLSTQLRTLHWKGAKDVPLEKQLQAKLMLTLLVIWFGDGTIEVLCVIKSTNGRSYWEQHRGVWFFRAFGSKMTSKQTYPELLQVLLRKNRTVRLAPDDDHNGHKGTNGDHVLLQLDPPVVRVRVQGGCTGDLATADQTQCNKELKKLQRKLLRQERIRTLLADKTVLFDENLTAKGCDLIGNLLNKIRTQWNASEERKLGVRNAFKQTLYPSKKKNKRLQARLDRCNEKGLTPVYNPFGADPNAAEFCKLCNHSFATPLQKETHEKDPNNCWGRRNVLTPPLFPDQNPNNAPVGMVVRISGRQLGVVVDHNVVYKLNNEVERLPNQFWKKAGLNLEYFTKRGKHEQMYEQLQAQIDEALRMYNCRATLTPPLANATLFEMDRKVHFFDGMNAWVLPQTRGKVLFL